MKPLGKGSLLIAKYDYFKNDPYPLILVTALYSQPPRAGMLAGINLHYLTFNYVKFLVQNYCNNRGFSYLTIKGDPYIVQAFRTYKKSGLRQGKLLDKDFFLNVMGSVRSFDPSQIDKIRQHIQNQLRQKVNVRSDDMQQDMKATIPGQPASIPGSPASVPGKPASQ